MAEISQKVQVKIEQLFAKLAANDFAFVSVNEKLNRQDLVTNLDLTLDREISQFMQMSELQIVSEEAYELAKSSVSENTLFVDPIDGTANLTSGVPNFGVSVGLLTAGEFTAGGVLLPKLNSVYLVNGNCSYLNGKKIEVNQKALNEATVCASFSRSTNKDLQFQLFRKFDELGRLNLRLGCTAQNICYVADGKAGVAYGLGLRLWDVAGGLAIAKHSGAQYWLNIKDNLFCDFLVASPSAFDEAKEVLFDLISMSN